ncbi:hypothetical protein JAAARDRAFT_46554 [Jaapia argillacea MUCL 33604]|uniref:Uncharacterized protein n=1 Tax=Jaapia argillacea MUCL 33604 TaxID=933084 RepID=A0A067Q5X8_9AGAM|nr:hypothetical protein JAAARDRAFT_46554 [Jaapia argillacea MUCL 33604]
MANKGDKTIYSLFNPDLRDPGASGRMTELQPCIPVNQWERASICEGQLCQPGLEIRPNILDVGVIIKGDMDMVKSVTIQKGIKIAFWVAVVNGVEHEFQKGDASDTLIQCIHHNKKRAGWLIRLLQWVEKKFLELVLVVRGDWFTESMA